MDIDQEVINLAQGCHDSGIRWWPPVNDRGEGVDFNLAQRRLLGQISTSTLARADQLDPTGALSQRLRELQAFVAWWWS